MTITRKHARFLGASKSRWSSQEPSLALSSPDLRLLRYFAFSVVDLLGGLRIVVPSFACCLRSCRSCGAIGSARARRRPSEGRLTARAPCAPLPRRQRSAGSAMHRKPLHQLFFCSLCGVLARSPAQRARVLCGDVRCCVARFGAEAGSVYLLLTSSTSVVSNCAATASHAPWSWALCFRCGERWMRCCSYGLRKVSFGIQWVSFATYALVAIGVPGFHRCPTPLRQRSRGWHVRSRLRQPPRSLPSPSATTPLRPPPGPRKCRTLPELSQTRPCARRATRS
mmetsp:Transcript_32514/g.100617  ORF Transcript_32514/g.100617 Transcript_32514/m.100617 type:complete len:282 (+) Transcript_32514:377-1222(+)